MLSQDNASFMKQIKEGSDLYNGEVQRAHDEVHSKLKNVLGDFFPPAAPPNPCCAQQTACRSHCWDLQPLVTAPPRGASLRSGSPGGGRGRPRHRSRAAPRVILGTWRALTGCLSAETRRARPRQLCLIREIWRV